MTTTGISILIVDDERSIADTLLSIVKKYGFTGFACYSAEEALRLLDSFVPDILLSDVMMEGMSGVQLAIEVTKKKAKTRIVLISGNAATHDLLEDAKRDGYAFEILAKPFPPLELINVLRNVRSED